LNTNQAVLESCEQVYVIRLSRLFGKPAKNSGKKSFFETMLSLSETKNELQAVDDEISCFTYAPDLARATRDLVSGDAPFGIYHCVNDGEVSWHDALTLLFTHLEKDTLLHKVSGLSFIRKAKRPAYSALSSTKRPPLRSLSDALREYVTTLENVSKRV
jgi:dTDP-4-dehydrorhamnose reductase